MAKPSNSDKNTGSSSDKAKAHAAQIRASAQNGKRGSGQSASGTWRGKGK